MPNTNVTFLLDRSGSMEQIKDDTIGAFNAYLGGLAGSDQIIFSLVQFDSQGLDKVCVRVPVDQAPKLDKDNFKPRASTPLIDACYKTIKAVEASLQAADASETKVVICIQTDGHENCSTEFTWDDLNALIKEKTALGWQFNFMGAGIDAYDQGRKMGISVANTMSYDAQNAAATQAAFQGRATATTMYASGFRASMSISGAEKLAAGDKYAPDLKRPHGPGQKPVIQPTPTPTVAVTRKKAAPSVDEFKL